MTHHHHDPPASEWPKGMVRPAAGAFSHAGITHLDQLVDYTETEILALHGVGPAAVTRGGAIAGMMTTADLMAFSKGVDRADRVG